MFFTLIGLELWHLEQIIGVCALVYCYTVGDSKGDIDLIMLTLIDEICLRDFAETEPGKTSRTKLTYVHVNVVKKNQNNQSISVIYQTNFKGKC